MRHSGLTPLICFPFCQSKSSPLTVELTCSTCRRPTRAFEQSSSLERLFKSMHGNGRATSSSRKSIGVQSPRSEDYLVSTSLKVSKRVYSDCKSTTSTSFSFIKRTQCVPWKASFAQDTLNELINVFFVLCRDDSSNELRYQRRLVSLLGNGQMESCWGIHSPFIWISLNLLIEVAFLSDNGSV